MKKLHILTLLLFAFSFIQAQEAESKTG